MFRSFVWGGFEGASHRRADRRRVDSIAGSGHDRWAMLHAAILRSLGIRTVRESLRWHLIEATAGRRDWSSAQRQVDAAREHGLSVIWGLCHWGMPDHIDVLAPCWPQRLAEFSAAAAEWLRGEGVEIAAWVPVNEIAFWSWAGGEDGGFQPYLRRDGDRLKRQLVRGHMASVAALRGVGMRQPVMVCEPLIHVMPGSPARAAARKAAGLVHGAFTAVDMIIAADPSAIDILGLNYYPHNQWRTGGRRIAPDMPGYRPLRDLLGDVARRFPQLRLALSETGQEEPGGAAWLRHITDEATAAAAMGVTLEGVCIYPILDYPGWDNARHCACGPIGHDRGRHFVRAEHGAAIAELTDAAQGFITLRCADARSTA